MTDRLLRTATRTHSFSESVIREMTRVAREHDAINLAQGFPDFPAPQLLKDAACAAIQGDVNQYAITWGTANLRNALSEKYAAMYDLEFDPEREITVTCGATEAMAAVMLATIDPGEEVIVFEPFYENYGPDAVLSQASPVFLPLEAPDYRVERDRLEAVVTPKTRAIVVNTPNNPTGRVFDRDELQAIADICREYDILAITDEIYEHIYYESEHLVLAGFEGMRDRTITVSGLSKTFSVTGWRVGTIMAPRSGRCTTSSPSELLPHCRRPVRSVFVSSVRTTTHKWSSATRSGAGSCYRRCKQRDSDARRRRAPITCWQTSAGCPTRTTRRSRSA